VCVCVCGKYFGNIQETKVKKIWQHLGERAQKYLSMDKMSLEIKQSLVLELFIWNSRCVRHHNL